MRILEYGNINNSTIMLVHGFESPYQIWIDYIEHYKENYHILVPILPGHDMREKSEFNSFDDTAKEIENYCISKSINHIYAILWNEHGWSCSIIFMEKQEAHF